ncbi:MULTISPECIES: hypothetical protein [unclassified Treponema]|uniref:hypothetical protein n=1 Tax=unclassified Treponema TaxID=2638727 RepID=UPI0020A45ACF|nr:MULTISPECIES: hypothetical protein [unclassified Treponema]UTC68162.1 hypothetical protein E4O06_05880 [Treponema sp. OMZ 789]UTC70882.1 hypothetical protein E4O01_06025 [Treponema sp. OMZ 790]UTC73622.1 hypothetical protein E4O02_06220 [Treponema sp. OMZ 791]
MALDFNKIEEPDDSVFPVKLEDDSNLDMYGVWVKKRPEHKDGYENELPTENDTAEDPFDNDIIEFDDHDVVDLDNSDESLEFEELTTINNFETIDSDDSFEDLGIISDDSDIITSDEDGISQESITEENTIYDGDEFDIFAESDAEIIDEGLENEEEQKPDINEFETLDVDDFLSDEEDSAASSYDENESNDETDNLIPDNDNIKLDLSFDEDYLETKESDAIDFEGNDSFEIIADEPDTYDTEKDDTASKIENLPERTIEDISDFDEIFDELEAKDETSEETVEEKSNDIPLNITIDEYSDITSLAGKTMGTDDDLEDVEIFSDVADFEDVEEPNHADKNDNDGLVIESTIIEAGNIEEIKKENEKIMNNSDFDSMLDDLMDEDSKTEETEEAFTEEPAQKKSIFFDDIEALENDLLDSNGDEALQDNLETELHKETNNEKEKSSQSAVLANDKATEILIQIAGELVNIKNELATMKFEMAQTQQKLEESNGAESQAPAVADTILNEVTESDKTGFFNDDDGDETIALTGDELNNILITADFMEENTEKDYEIPETLDEIDEAFLDDDADTDNETEADTEVFSDEDLLNAVEPEHINDLREDVSYLDEEGGIDLEDETVQGIDFDTFDENTDTPAQEDTSIEIEDFVSEEKEIDDDKQGSIDEFDLPITELELPDGQSIPLGDEYSGFETIKENIEEGHDEALSLEDGNTVFSPEELDMAAKDIPRLELDESAAEEQKIKTETLPIHLKDEIKSVLTYMDQLLESLPEEKIEEFAKSEYFDTYKRLFDELGIS